MNRRIILATIVLFSVIIGLISYFYFVKDNRIGTDSSRANSVSATITTKANWDAGTLDNIDSTSSAGSIKKDVKTGGEINLGAIYNEDPTKLTASFNTGKERMITHSGTIIDWPWYISPPGEQWWLFDLGTSSYTNASRVGVNCDGDGKEMPYPGYIHCHDPALPDSYMHLDISANGSDWTTIRNLSVPIETDSAPTSHTPVLTGYVRITSNYFGLDSTPDEDGYRRFFGIGSLRLWEPSVPSSHTTAATQIDGGANFWEWESFTPTQTVPPGTTSVTYRYRTTPNSDDTGWTAWVSDIGSVTSRTGDDSNNPTKYRYLQVEATLSNTDGVSTPTIDSYDIGYHTNVKPSKPTAQTAVIGN